MATLKQKVEAEVKVRELVEDSGLPPPDEVEYGHTCIRLFWHDTKTMLVIDIDEPPDGWDGLGRTDGALVDDFPGSDG